MLLTVFLPIALGIIMLGLGLSLTIGDFKRIVLFPKAVFIGLFCQMILLPLVCFGLAAGFGLAPALAVGLMLLSASPGGATANLYSHLSDGDVALNITLTAINSLLTLITLPLIVNFSLTYFMGAEQSITMQFGKILEVFAIVLLPVILGMSIRKLKPTFADSMEKPVKIASAMLLVAVIAAATIRERANLLGYIQEMGLPVLLFNLLSMATGYFVPLLLKVERRQAVAIGMEIGIHNGTLAIFIALSVLDNSQMSLPPALYSLLMFFTAAAFGFWVKKQNKTAEIL
jgi:bile acid:Na+ symporter, BASS family